jgi:hypothetical protein
MNKLHAILQQPVSKFAQANPGGFVRFTPPSLCPVCFNLDAFRVPPEHNREQGERSWARLEFKVPDETPAVRIRIDKGTNLVESAQQGECLTCTMVAAALSSIAPGWKEKESFINLFLAPGLTLVVRLELGKTVEMSIGHEEARAYGFALREGQILRLDIDVKHYDEEWGTNSVEVELYRPSVIQEEATVGGECFSPRVNTPPPFFINR